MKTAIFPGSFDPFTRGHWDIACRALKMFEKLYIAIGYNANKQGMITPECRAQLIRDSFAANDRVEVVVYNGLTVDLSRKLDVKILLHGVRTFSDFEYERQIAEVNSQIKGDLENVFLLASPGFASVSSSAVRELIFHGADVSGFLPPGIDIKNYL